MSVLLRRLCLPKTTAVLARARSSAQTSAELPQDAPVEVLEDEESIEKAKQLEKSRNKSRLNRKHFNIINGRLPYEEAMIPAHCTLKYHRKLYGKYGEYSGIDPSLCFPTSEEIKETLEYEKVAYPFTIQEMAQQVLERRTAEKARIKEREDAIEAKLLRLDQWKKELQDKLMKREAETRAVKEKRERLVEEVRRFFGFKLDHRDERFQEMLAKKEKEQKQKEKLAKREAKEKEMLAKIQKKSAAIETTA